MVSPSGMNLNSSGTYVLGSNEGIPVPVSRSSVPGVPSVGHLVALHPTSAPQIAEVPNPTNIMKIDNVHPQLIASKGISSQNQNEILKVAHNTQLIHSQSEKSLSTTTLSGTSTAAGTPSFITSLLNNPAPPVIGVSASNTESSTISLHLTGSENKVNIVSADGKQLADFSSNALISTHPGQVPLNNSAVIVSSNSFLPGAIISGKTAAAAAAAAAGGVNSQNVDVGTTTLTTTTATASAQAHFVTCNTLNNSKGINSSIPVSMHVIDASSKSGGGAFQGNQYLSTGPVKTNIIEANRVKKSNKKKKKEKETDTCAVSFISSGYHVTTQEKSAKTAASHNVVVSTHSLTLSSSALMPNGGITVSSSLSGTTGAAGNATSKGQISTTGVHSSRVESSGALVSGSHHHSNQSQPLQHPMQVFSHVVVSTNSNATGMSTAISSCAASPSSLAPTSSSSSYIGTCVSNSISNVITVTSNSIVSTLSNSHSSTNVTTVSCLTSTPTAGVTRMSIPIGTSSHTSSLNPAPSFVVQPGQQVKQLLLSPQNQEVRNQSRNRMYSYRTIALYHI